MIKKMILMINLLIILSILYGCSAPNGEIFPTTIPLEQSIKEIIVSKGANYDFLNDELFKNKVDEFANSIIKNDSGSDIHYIIGNLDDDNIPELIILVERNPNDVNDKGGLGVYKFNGERYQLLDKIDMNYDKSNYLLKTGKLSQTQSGILLSNHVGAHSTITYGYIIEDGKLKNVLNEKKTSLVSAYPNNEIKDFDDDGVLEFSIYTNDPESEEQSTAGSEKLILWYKWDENDSANLVKIIRESSSVSKNLATEKKPFSTESGEKPSFDYIKNNMDKYDKNQLSQILEGHISTLETGSKEISREINNIFTKYQKDNNFNFLIEKYDLSIERLNDMEYLKREKILHSEIELKDHLMKHMEMGYRLASSEGMYYYVIDYQRLINHFNVNITNHFRDYLNIKALDVNEPYLRDDAFLITRDKLSERIVALENFKLTYPYSNKMEEINDLYKSYINVLLFGSGNTPNYDIDTNKFSEGSLAVFRSIMDKYPHTYLVDIIQKLLVNLDLNLGVLNDDTKNLIYKMIN